MIRGTTPKVSFNLPFNASTAVRLWVTFSQRNKEVFTLEKEDFTISEDKIEATLTQEQTLCLVPNAIVEMQIRVLFPDEKNTYTALASNIMTTPVQRILKEGEI